MKNNVKAHIYKLLIISQFETENKFRKSQEFSDESWLFLYE